ncbi:hypothetical protein VNO80_13725 [Phaseolus coccineus]|uniref:Uncharacterized protein n=1 Tax=Phaseolus coccineus TaxID=3886 RepID=A0AAN9N1L2_PHACN
MFSAQDCVLSKSLHNCNVVNFNFIDLYIFIASLLFSQLSSVSLPILHSYFAYICSISPVHGDFLVHICSRYIQ